MEQGKSFIHVKLFQVLSDLAKIQERGKNRQSPECRMGYFRASQSAEKSRKAQRRFEILNVREYI